MADFFMSDFFPDTDWMDFLFLRSRKIRANPFNLCHPCLSGRQACAISKQKKCGYAVGYGPEKPGGYPTPVEYKTEEGIVQ